MSEPAVDSPTQTPGPLPDRVPHAGVRYALLRVSMLVSVGVILYAAGLRGLLLVVLAFLVSGLVSYFVLMRQRDAAAANLERQVRGWGTRRRRAEEGTPLGTQATANAEAGDDDDAPARSGDDRVEPA